MKRELNPSPHVSRFTFHVASLFLYTLLTAVMTWPLARNLTSAIPGDSFDGWQNFWNLWWVKLALVDRQTTPFVTDLLYAPTGVGLYFHTLNPFNGLATLPIQLAGGLYAAYNAVVFLSWVLGGYGVFLLTLWVLRNEQPEFFKKTRVVHFAAFVAGLIFTFAPFHMAHLLGHMQVMSLEWMPFYILYLLRASQRQTAGQPWLRDSLLAGLFLVLVGLCDWYFVLYLFLFTGLYLVLNVGYSVFRRRTEPAIRHTPYQRKIDVLCVSCRRWFVTANKRMTRIVGSRPSKVGYPQRAFAPDLFALSSYSLSYGLWLRHLTQYAVRTLLPATLAGLVFLLLLSPILVPMISEALRFSFMQRPASDLYILSAAVMDFFVPNRLHTLFRPESFTWVGNQLAPVSERTISVGYTALGLVGLAGVWARRQSAFWLAVALFFFLLALGPALHLTDITAADIPAGDPGPTFTLYGVLVEAIPFMRISRSVSRFAVMVQLALSVVAGIGLYELLKRKGRPSLWLSLAALLVLAEFWVAPFPISPPDTPDFYRQLAADSSPGAVLNLPMNYDRPGYLLYQTVHGKPLTVAYISRDDPRTLTERSPVLQHFRHLGPDILDVDPATLGLTVLADLGVGWVVADRYKMPGGLEREYTSALVGAIFAGQPPIFEDARITAWRVTPPDVAQPYLLLGPLGWGPLAEEDGMPGRWLGEESAGLLFQHTSAINSRVTIRYRTQPGVTVSVLLPGLADVQIASLPPAPDSGEAKLDFGPLLAGLNVSTPIETISEITFSASAPASVFVESIRLDTLPKTK